MVYTLLDYTINPDTCQSFTSCRRRSRRTLFDNLPRRSYTIKVTTLILLIIIPWFVDISAFVFIGIWFVLQLFSGLTALSTPSSLNAGGVAWWAHIGGFLFGLLLAYPFLAGKQTRQLPQ